MILWVCWSTVGGDRHACAKAAAALRAAGHEPEVRRAYGSRLLPDALNVTEGRREAKRRTGSTAVPMLILDDDTTVSGSRQIVDWARANPA